MSRYYKEDMCYIFLRNILDSISFINEEIQLGFFFKPQLEVLKLRDTASYLRQRDLCSLFDNLNQSISTRNIEESLFFSKCLAKEVNCKLEQY